MIKLGLGKSTCIGDVPDNQFEQRMPFILEQSRRETRLILHLPISWGEELLSVIVFYMLSFITTFTYLW